MKFLILVFLFSSILAEEGNESETGADPSLGNEVNEAGTVGNDVNDGEMPEIIYGSYGDTGVFYDSFGMFSYFSFLIYLN